MELSRRIARIVGPVLTALSITEAANLRAFAGNSAAVVYLNGTLLFAAGVAILQAHARLARDWTLLVTLAGWGLALLGLYRMVIPAGPQAQPGAAAWAMFAALLGGGGVLTWQGYHRVRA